MPNQNVTPPGHDSGMERETESMERNPDFRYEIRLCASFEDVVDQAGRSVAVEDLPTIALDTGRLLIQAPGGAGKTTTLNRVAVSVAESGLRTVRVWSVEWVAAATAERVEVDVAALDATLEAVSEPAISSKGFADGVSTLLLVDGLNELHAGYARLLVDTLDRLASRYPSLGIIVADRLVRRSISEGWQLATLTPVPESQIRELMGDDLSEAQIGLLSTPFYLDHAQQNSVSAGTHRAFFESQLKLSHEELLVLAAAVNAQYKSRGDRLMETRSLIDSVGDDVVTRLKGGVLLERGEEAFFNHHLISDFLASVDLSLFPERWNPSEFDSLTFYASSFDPLAILLEEVSAQDVDALIRRIYDWNFYGAAYLLSQDDVSGRRISDDVRTALLCLLAERRFDRLITTAREASDSLRLQRSDIARLLRSAQDVGGVIGIVSSLPNESEWFERWRNIFLNRTAWSDVLEALQSADGILGWTAANVLKRRPLDSSESLKVAAILHDGESSARWRAAHVLGKATDPTSVNGLLESIHGDEYQWVRYGSLRSLVEIASSSSDRDMREYIFLSLGEMAEEIGSKATLAKEVERALAVSSPPESWAEDAGLLLERLWAAADTIDEQDRWRRLSAGLRGAAA